MERPKLTKKHATFDSSTSMQYYMQNRLDEQHEQLGDDQIETTKLPPIQNAQSNPYHQMESKNDQNLKWRPQIPPKSTQFQIQQITPTSTPTNTIQNIPQNTIQMNIDNTVDDKIVDDDDNINDLCQHIDQTHRLSKLTLSSSLHMINDSKFINQQHQQQQTQSSDSTTKTHLTFTDKNAQNDLINSNGNKLNNQPNGNHYQLPKIDTIQSTGLNKNNHSNRHNLKYKKHSHNHKKHEANLDTVHVVVGNESCDLDSAVSCLLVFHIISKISDEINGKDKSRTLYIPLLNTTRDMLDSKSEVLWFLQRTLNIDKSFLTCKDDIDWAEIKKNGIEVLVTLVDHNYNEEFKDIGRIVEIIDHHQVQDPRWLMQNHQQMRLTLDTSVGSCTTLVAERLFYIYAEHHVSDEILLLIYGTILLDTICLSEKAKRFTRRDVYLLRKLDTLLGPRKPNRDELYKQLVGAKNSTREFNFERLMKRDLKIYKDKNGIRIGIASLFGMAAKEALGLAANVDLDQFFCQNKYEAFIIMGLIADLDQSDGISRDLVLISANEKLFDELCGAFEDESNKLDLVIIGGPRAGSTDPEDINMLASSLSTSISANKQLAAAPAAPSPVASSKDSFSKQNSIINTSMDQQTSTGLHYRTRIWIQRNVTSSRKVVAPLVLKVLHDGAWATTSCS